MIVGVKEVLVSLWTVPDTLETCRFVDTFYKYYCKQQEADVALREAQLWAKREHISEELWSSYFVMKQRN